MSGPSDNAAMLAIATEATERAGQIILGGDPGTVTDKGDRDLSSEMDLASEHAVREMLNELTPDIPLLGEEEGGPDPASGLVWVLDPIDGTVNYIHQLPTWGVALSLIEDGQTRVAAIHMPATKMTYKAAVGEGAYVGDTRLKASTTSVLSESLIAIDQFTFVDDDPEQVNARRLSLMEQLTPIVHRIRVNGCSAVDLSWTAQGKLDACIMLANNPWDTSAGTLLAREAGALVFDLEGNNHHIRSATTIAVAPQMASKFLKVLEDATAAIS